jgi:nucleotide-binding universal stress UspA family protein
MVDSSDFDDVLVPTDGSEAARATAEQAVRFAKGNDARLHAPYAIEMGDADHVAVPSDIAETRTRMEKKDREYTAVVDREYTAVVEELAAGAGVECVSTVVANTPVECVSTT